MKECFLRWSGIVQFPGTGFSPSSEASGLPEVGCCTKRIWCCTTSLLMCLPRLTFRRPDPMARQSRGGWTEVEDRTVTLPYVLLFCAAFQWTGRGVHVYVKGTSLTDAQVLALVNTAVQDRRFIAMIRWVRRVRCKTSPFPGENPNTHTLR